MSRVAGRARGPLVRQRLVHGLTTRLAPLTLLQAPAGLGKSILVEAVALRLGGHRSRLVTSTDELHLAMKRLAHHDERPAAELLLVDAEAEPVQLDEFVRLVLERGGHAVVATRTALGVVTPRLLLDGSVHVLTTEHLLFTADEVRTLAAERRARLSPDELADLHRATDGWPALVDAALRTERPPGPAASAWLPETARRFVRTEVVGPMPADVVTELTRAAAVPEFDASVVAALVADLPTDPVGLIDEWVSAGWIVRGGGPGRWRLLRPIRECLVTGLDLRHPGRRAELVATAARHLVEANRTVEALPYLAEAALDDQLADVLRQTWISELVAGGRLAELRPIITALPDRIMAGDADLLLAASMFTLAHPPDLTAFAARLAQAAAVIDHDRLNGPLLSHHAQSMLLARIRGDLDRADDLERTARAHLDAATDHERHQHAYRLAFFTHQAGSSRLAAGRLPEAADMLRHALTLARSNQANWQAATSGTLLAYTSFLRGDLDDARREALTALGLAREIGQDHAQFTDHIHLTLALLELERGRTIGVADLLHEARVRMAGDAEPPAARLALAWSTLGLLTQDAVPAEHAMLLCDRDDPSGRLPFNAFLEVVARAQVLLVRDEPEAALAATAGVTPLGGHAGLLAVVRARAHLALDDALAAHRELTVADGAEALPPTVGADVLALRAECALREGENATPTFHRLLALLGHTDIRRPILLAPLLRDAVAEGRLTVPPSSPQATLGLEIAALTHANHDGPPDLSAREREILSALAGAASLPRIARDLYVSPNTVKSATRAVYRKLRVIDRRQATIVARALGLLPDSG